MTNENSVDVDEMDLALSLAFPETAPTTMDNMKKYTDDIWRKTLWEKQPETQTPAIVWPSTSKLCMPSHNEDIWSNLSGGNIFFPTTAPSPSTSSFNKQPFGEVKHRKKVVADATTSSSEFEDDFNHMKKRLSLSSLRTSLCRQKAMENLNNEHTACNSEALDVADELLQVEF